MNLIKTLLVSLTMFEPSTQQYNSFELRYDGDGKVYHKARAHGNLTAKTPYKITVNEYGPVTSALANEATYSYVGVPLAAISSGADGWLQIGGYITGVITASLSMAVGEACNVTSGAIADAGADYEGLVAQWAVATAATTTSTTQTLMLVPKQFLQN